MLREWLIHDLKKLPEVRQQLQNATNLLEIEWLKRKIADMERLLEQLGEVDRLIVETLVIEKGKISALTTATGLSSKEITERKNEALHLLCQLRFGAGYQP